MTTSAQSVIRRAATTLKDLLAVRWPADELVRWLNPGQVAIAMARPSEFTVLGAVALTAGTRQTLPADGFRVVDVLCNTAAPKTAVRLVDRRLLDESNPAWRGMSGAATVSHFYFDPRDERAFYVYPPANSSAQVDVLYAAYPAPVTEPAPGSDYTAVTGNISVPDIYAEALVDYILARAFSKDSELTVNAARAQAHYQAFANALGIDATTAAAVAPGAQQGAA